MNHTRAIVSAVIGSFLFFGGVVLAGQIIEGSTRAEVIRTYGEPTGSVRSGSEEILSYPQGFVSLRDDAVILIDPRWGATQPDPKTVSKQTEKEQRKWWEKERTPAATQPKKETGTKKPTENVKVFAQKGRAIDLQTVLEPGLITIVDFYADWCPPCRRIAPELERLAVSDPDVVLRKIDIVNWETPVVKQYAIRSVPNIRVFDRNGKMVGNPTASLQEVKQYIKRAK